MTATYDRAVGEATRIAIRLSRRHAAVQDRFNRFVKVLNCRDDVILGTDAGGNMMKAFQDLGQMTEATWSRLGGHEEAFPEAATLALGESGVLNQVDVSSIVDWFAGNDVPEQYANEFGQPPINVYVADKFYIHVLFWLDATTAVHAHGFTGAFGVLAGSSVHSQYQFDVDQPLAKELQLGHVRYISSELLKKGDLRTISGNSFIHALFHLDRPSVSVVVRTKSSKKTVQYNYLTPHVALDPLFKDPLITIKLRLLDSLQSIRSEQLWDYAERLITEQTPWTAYHTLATAYRLSRPNASRWQHLVGKAKAVWGEQNVEWMLASIKFDERGLKLSRLRSVVHDPNYRFLLALLLNVPSRRILLKLVQTQYNTESPESLVMQWIREMSAAGLFMTNLDPEILAIIELALRYGTFQKARAAVINDNHLWSTLLDEQAMRTIWDKVSVNSFFQPLFEMTEAPEEKLTVTAA
jgi:hypothetical protein